MAYAGNQLRDYQHDFVATICREPGCFVATLRTGAGKTRIAFEVMKDALRRDPRRSVLFLAPTNTLVDQQADEWKKAVADDDSISRNIACVRGGSGRFPDAGYCDMFCGAIFATPGSVTPQMMEERGWDWLSLMVLDECHHAILQTGTNNRAAVSGHPMSQLAISWGDATLHRRPRILGLTASPGRRQADVKRLCETLDAQLLFVNSVHLAEISANVHVPKLLTWVVPPAYAPWQEALQSITAYKKTCSLDGCLSACCEHLLRVLRGVGCCDFVLPQLLANADHDYDSQNWQDEMFRCWEMFVSADLEDNLALEHGRSPMMSRLLRDLEKDANDVGPSSFSAIVFVATKLQADLTAMAIRQFASQRPHLTLVPCIMVGVNSSTVAANKAVMARFRAREANILVATSVAEEGLDVQSVSTVIRTEPPATIISLIQSRGRARFPDSRYRVYCAEEQEHVELQQMSLEEQEIDEILADAQAHRSAQPPAQTNKGRPFQLYPAAAASASYASPSPSPPPQEPMYEPIHEHLRAGANSKSKLNELLQRVYRHGQGNSCIYKLISSSPIAPPFQSSVTLVWLNKTVAGTPGHHTKMASEQDAAFRALLYLENEEF